MKLRNVVLAALLTSLTAVPVTAQAWKWDFGVNAGYARFNKLLDAEQTGLPDDSPAEEIKFAHGLIYGAQLTFWPSSKLGFRLNGRYGAHDVKGNDLDDFDFVEDVNLWAGTLDLMLRLGQPAEEFAGMEVLPFLAGGLGLKWHNPGNDQFTCDDTTEGKSWTCGPFTTGLPGASARTFAIGELKQFMGHVGLGADWRLSRGFALRTEISDQIYRPRVNQAARVGTTNNFTLVQSDNNVASVVHELAGQVGLHFLFGVPRAAEVVVVAPPPSQPAPVTPAPVTPAPPARNMVSVCVVDPTVAGGIRTESAWFYPARGDTMLTVNGQEVLLRNAVGNVMVASNADWYVRGQPLSMTVGGEKIEFVTTGTAQMVQSSELAFLGTVNGLPVYADKDEVADVREELAELNRAQRGTDLAKLLEEHKDLREDLADVKVFFVPLQPTGCVFQAVTRTEAVRKNKQ